MSEIITAMSICDNINRKEMADYARNTYNKYVISLRYSLYFEKLFYYHFYQTLVYPTMSRNYINIINNKIINQDKMVTSGPIKEIF